MDPVTPQPDNFSKDMIIAFGLIGGVFVVFLLLLAFSGILVKSKIDFSKLGTFDFSSDSEINSNVEIEKPQPVKPNKVNTNNQNIQDANSPCVYFQIQISGMESNLCYSQSDYNTLNNLTTGYNTTFSRLTQNKNFYNSNCVAGNMSDSLRDTCATYMQNIEASSKILEMQKNIINSIKERGKP